MKLAEHISSKSTFVGVGCVLLSKALAALGLGIGLSVGLGAFAAGAILYWLPPKESFSWWKWAFHLSIIAMLAALLITMVSKRG